MNDQNYITVVRSELLADKSLAFTAFHPELPTVIAQGSSAEEAIQELDEMTKTTISYLMQTCHAIPPAQLLSGVVDKNLWPNFEQDEVARSSGMEFA